MIFGNGHASKFTELQATNFVKHWTVVAQQADTTTGLSGTLFRCTADDPSTGAKDGELVMSFRSTEFLDDYRSIGASHDVNTTACASAFPISHRFGQVACLAFAE